MKFHVPIPSSCSPWGVSSWNVGARANGTVGHTTKTSLCPSACPLRHPCLPYPSHLQNRGNMTYSLVPSCIDGCEAAGDPQVIWHGHHRKDNSKQWAVCTSWCQGKWPSCRQQATTQLLNQQLISSKAEYLPVLSSDVKVPVQETVWYVSWNTKV